MLLQFKHTPKAADTGNKLLAPVEKRVAARSAVGAQIKLRVGCFSSPHFLTRDEQNSGIH